MEKKFYFFNNEIALTDLGSGIKRKILAYQSNLMAVEVYFEEGAIGAVHSHPHDQITYVLNGEFEYQIGDRKEVLKAGDSTYLEPGILHGTVCLKEGILLDIFTPQRDDFLD